MKPSYDMVCPHCGHKFWQGMALEGANPQRYYVQCSSMKCNWKTPYFITEQKALEYFRSPTKPNWWRRIFLGRP